ncbi:protease inhibitor SIL-V5 [Streptomyces solincola]|uniref:Protease inhibitor SIL-V5 n=2 Tax=Streptomyces solincola TaxID=2100817 RepID=A0A2S9PPD6_9ACTN|nr:protease inhibitor SIL-V5 [Streptomyces solincola]
MSLRATATATAFAAVLLTTAAAPGPAGADPVDRAAGAAPAAGSGLFLTVSGADESWIRGVRLHCAPTPSGPHPEAKAACAALESARGDLDKLTSEERPCTKRFDPVSVRAAGEWQGKAVDWRKSYGNACLLDTATGALFRF